MPIINDDVMTDNLAVVPSQSNPIFEGGGDLSFFGLNLVESTMGNSNLIGGSTFNSDVVSFGKAEDQGKDLGPRQDLMGADNDFVLTEVCAGGPRGALLGFGLNASGESGGGSSDLMEVGIGPAPVSIRGQ